MGGSWEYPPPVFLVAGQKGYEFTGGTGGENLNPALYEPRNAAVAAHNSKSPPVPLVRIKFCRTECGGKS